MGRYENSKIINFSIGMELIEYILAGIDEIQGNLNYKPVFVQKIKLN